MYDYFLIIGNIVEPATLVSATDKTLNIKTVGFNRNNRNKLLKIT